MENYKATPEWNEMNGKFEALRVAFLTLVKCMPADVIVEFKSSYPINIENWKEAGLPQPLSEVWFQSITRTSGTLLRALD